jgi:rubrerythrin
VRSLDLIWAYTEFEREVNMSFDSYEEIINFAIEKEKEAAAFYEEASRQETYSGAKETFESFAKEFWIQVHMDSRHETKRLSRGSEI